VKIPHIIDAFARNLINKCANPFGANANPRFGQREFVWPSVTNNDTRKLTSSLESQSDSTHIRALDAVLSPQVSEISVLYSLIDKLSILIISAHNLAECPIAYWWFFWIQCVKIPHIIDAFARNLINKRVNPFGENANPRFGQREFVWTSCQLYDQQ
jgi:hypothetical protein